MPKLPGIHHKDAIRVLQKLGWRVIREGKHTILGKGTDALPIPRSFGFPEVLPKGFPGHPAFQSGRRSVFLVVRIFRGAAEAMFRSFGFPECLSERFFVASAG